MNRIIIKELIVTGNGKSDATLSFKKGLNIISGASNTGKTYVYQCIDYAFGASTKPKSFNLAKDYNEIILCFMLSDGREYKIRRGIGENYVLVESLTENNNKLKRLPCAHNPRNANNLSRWLLRLLGSNEVIQIRKNFENDKRTMSFRDLIHLSLISETDIIANRSAFLASQYDKALQCISIFDFIMTGVDDSNLTKIEKKEIREAQLYGKLLYIKDYFLRNTNRIAEVKKLLDQHNSDFDIVFINSKISDLKNRLLLENSNLHISIENTSQIESKIFEEQINIEKLKNLKNDYNLEIKKTNVIDEYAGCIIQVPVIDCPFCGQKIKEALISEEDNNALIEKMDVEKVRLERLVNEIDDIACTVEKRYKDAILQKTNLMHKIELQKKEISTVSDEIIEYESQIKNLKEIEELQNQLKFLEQENEQLEKTQKEIEENLKNLKSRKGKKDNDIKNKFHNKIYGTYCKIILEILTSWKLLGKDSSIDFNRQALDIIVNEEKRLSNGKGYMSIMMTAMVIGLMRYCFQNDKLHTGFVIIDSPISPYNEHKKVDGVIIESLVQKAMLEEIAKNDLERQVIIFEHEELDFGLGNYQKFWGADALNNQRKGFLPS